MPCDPVKQVIELKNWLNYQSAGTRILQPENYLIESIFEVLHGVAVNDFRGEKVPLMADVLREEVQDGTRRNSSKNLRRIALVQVWSHDDFLYQYSYVISYFQYRIIIKKTHSRISLHLLLILYILNGCISLEELEKNFNSNSLTNRNIPLKTRGRTYEACMRSILLYGSEIRTKVEVGEGTYSL